MSDYKLVKTGEQIDKILTKAFLSVSGHFETLSALEEAFPSGNSNLYVVDENNYWYYWSSDASQWVAGGQYLINDITEQLNEFVKKLPSINLFDKNAEDRIDGKYLNVYNDAPYAETNPDYMITGFIPVESSTQYYLTQMKSNPAKGGFYDENKQWIVGSEFVVSSQSTSITTSSTAKYVRFSVLIAQKDNAMVTKGSTAPTKYVPYLEYDPEFFLNDLDLLLNGRVYNFAKGKVDKIPSKNLFNKDDPDYVDGKYMYVSGNTLWMDTNASFCITGFIEVEAETTYFATNMRGTPAWFTFYDENKVWITNSGNKLSSQAATITTPANAKYIRLSFPKTQTNTAMFELGSVGSSSYIPYAQYYPTWLTEKLDNVRSKVVISSTNNIQDFLTAMQSAFEKGNCDVYIGPGNYVLDNATIEGMMPSSGYGGIKIGHNNRYFFDSGCFIIANYTGSQEQKIGGFFCPFQGNGYGSFELHNLNLYCSHVLYAIHDEQGGSTTPYKNIYDNCTVVIDNTNFTYGYNHAIGGGLGEYGEIQILNCSFNSVSNTECDVSYHGSTSTDGYSRLVISGCYFEHTVKLSATSGAHTRNCFLIYSNNSGSADLNVFSTEVPRWTIKKFNNEIRN